MRKTIGILAMLIFSIKFLTGCAGMNPYTAAGLGFTTGKAISELTLMQGRTTPDAGGPISGETLATPALEYRSVRPRQS